MRCPGGSNVDHSVTLTTHVSGKIQVCCDEENVNTGAMLNPLSTVKVGRIPGKVWKPTDMQRCINLFLELFCPSNLHAFTTVKIWNLSNNHASCIINVLCLFAHLRKYKTVLLDQC